MTDDQRRRLAVKGKILGHKRILEVGTLFTPDTILRWHRRLVADKWDNSDRQQPGRPRVRQVIVDLTVRFAKENPRWGCDRIQGALANVGYRITDTTVGNILKRHGIEPAPDRREGTTWSTFLKAHWDVLAASDFTTVEVWTKGGLVTFYLLFLMGPIAGGRNQNGRSPGPVTPTSISTATERRIPRRVTARSPRNRPTNSRPTSTTTTRGTR